MELCSCNPTDISVFCQRCAKIFDNAESRAFAELSRMECQMTALLKVLATGHERSQYTEDINRILSSTDSADDLPALRAIIGEYAPFDLVIIAL